MKITEERLIEKIKELRDDAKETLTMMDTEKMSQNSVRAGMEQGQLMTCDTILYWIEFGVEGESC